jgi:FtsZ-binding cell division protein ZapB
MSIEDIKIDINIETLKEENRSLKDKIDELRRENNSFLYSAMCRFKKEMPIIKKDAKSFGNQAYASLGHIQSIATPILAKHGLDLQQHYISKDGRPAIWNILTHSSGQIAESIFEIPEILIPKDEKNIAALRNSVGGLFSYFKRHTYVSILGIIIVS